MTTERTPNKGEPGEQRHSTGSLLSAVICLLQVTPGPAMREVPVEAQGTLIPTMELSRERVKAVARGVQETTPGRKARTMEETGEREPGVPRMDTLALAVAAA